jgi:hypothetical protein
MSRSHFAMFAAAWGVALTGCAGPESASRETVVDSAGVRIVQHDVLPRDTAFSVGEALLRVGWSEAEHEFQRIVGGKILADGGLVIGDAGSQELVYLTPAGAVDTIVGGAGQGPMEIGHLVSLNLLPGDTVVAEDDGNARVSFFHRGEYQRSYRIEGGAAALVFNAFGRVGRSLVTVPSGYRMEFPEPWLQGVVRVHPLETQSFDSILSYDWIPRTEQNVTSNPFRGLGTVGVAAGGIVVARGDRAEIEFRDLQGELRQIVRWTESRRPLSDGEWSQYTDLRASRNRSRTAEEFDRYMSELRAAVDEPLPYLAEIGGDDVDRVWVSEYSVEGRHFTAYRVFTSEGSWVGWVHLPPRTQVLDVRNDMLLVIQRSELDVESVALLPLMRHSGG